MFIEDVMNMCNRIMRQAAEQNPSSPHPQNVLAQANGNDGNAAKGENSLRIMLTVLLVENEPALLDALREVLEQSGYTVLTADSGEAAIRVCHGHNGRIDVLLSDVVMNRLDGFEVATIVKSVHPDLIVLLMSGSPIESFAQHSVADEFFAKPFAHQDLITAISRHTGLPANAGATSESRN